MRTFKLILAYDGTRYVGWQRQRNGMSIQALVEEACAPLEGGRAVRVAGAGRTDAGVHALGQVASCRLQSRLDVASLQRALNARLPADVRVLEVVEAPAGFHARYWARRKTYAYVILNGPVADPLARQLLWHVAPPLDVDAMRSALGRLLGRQDFKAFQAAGTRVVTTIRTVSAATLDVGPWQGILGRHLETGVRDQPRGVLGIGQESAIAGAQSPLMLTLTFSGDGFLRHMVRNFVGTVVDVGLGRRGPDGVTQVLAARDRQQAGITAPPQGLFLLSVEYGDGP